MAAPKKEKQKLTPNEQTLREGILLIDQSPLFSRLVGVPVIMDKGQMGKGAPALAVAGEYRNEIHLNKDCSLSPKEWAYTIAHCQLHFAFGHFDADKVPAVEYVNLDGKVERRLSFDAANWNLACDIFVSKLLSDIKFGTPTCSSLEQVQGFGKDELGIYETLMAKGVPAGVSFGTAGDGNMDMRGLEQPLTYESTWRKRNRAAETFATALAYSVSHVVSDAGGHVYKDKSEWTRAQRAADWFVNHYPLLGALAAGFKIVEDASYCIKNEISVAAVDVTLGEIYINPAARLEEEELRFVMAHEFLHAGLQHHLRCQGRDHYLWNVACDFVINAWLKEMQVGMMPHDGLLYDEGLQGRSAEEIYDIIVADLKKYSKLDTFRGYGKGDVIGSGDGKWKVDGTTSLDDFYRNALSQGLEYQISSGRGFIPEGLIEEIRALAMPPIPWDVELGRWFDVHFQPLEAKRTYARPSRRQGSTPDIPRPRYVPNEIPEYSRTFGVILDTSGSMDTKLLGYALGAIASYAAAKEVPYARVVFCDADAYDAGYLAPEDIAGRVAVKGRGGTVLQPGVEFLQGAKDFPKDAPILIITDGYIESDLRVKREHAFLLPKGRRLPFRPRGEVFYFSEK